MATISETDNDSEFELKSGGTADIQLPGSAQLTAEANPHVTLKFNPKTKRWIAQAQNPGTQSIAFLLNGKPWVIHFKIMAVETGAKAQLETGAAATAEEKVQLKKLLDLAQATRDTKFKDQSIVTNASLGGTDVGILASAASVFDSKRFKTATLEWLESAAKLAGVWTKHKDVQKNEMRYMFGYYLEQLKLTPSKAANIGRLADFVKDANRNAVEVAKLESQLRGSVDEMSEGKDIKSNFKSRPGGWCESTFFGLFQTKSCDYDTFDVKDPAPTVRLYAVMERMRGIDGLPQLHRVSVTDKLWILKGHHVKNDPSMQVPTLCDLTWFTKKPAAICETPVGDHKMETTGLELSYAAQLLFAIRLRNLITSMHLMGVTHNHLVPAHIRLDVSDAMTVYFTHPNWATLDFGKETNKPLGEDDAKKPVEETTFEWDFFTAWTTMKTIKWDTAANFLVGVNKQRWEEAGDWPALFAKRLLKMQNQK